ncbi:hypothetical protein TRFO_22607 [Tritrichomonas foetus]|uniref:Uncharacterized protein n=1 Tax=Tritrichomonas foetus TaxID=1144522 RepID=A0A1J4KCS8_9EUKA|nr:hypothetical protein TRFO_22607 [Tritrichomonas foetus]|eukprot:OHT08778.1 hypothetical protein TRFO_22607 [Tritrichomonas foetus]
MNLANQAKSKMKTRISKEHREDVYTRGQHKFPGIDFFLTTNLIGDSSKGVKGYSISKFNLSQSSTKKSNLYQ